MKKRKTLLDKYMDMTTFKERNMHPRTEGIVATLSDIVEREGAFNHLPRALESLHEFHRMSVDPSRLDKIEDKEKVATMMTLCFSMMLLDKQIADGVKRINQEQNNEPD